MYQLHFAYPQVFYIFIPIWIGINIYRWFFYKSPVYIYPLTSQIKKTKHVQKKHFGKILFLLQSFFLFGLIFLIARPQWVDSRSKTSVDGVDIIITLDISGSMQLFDDLKDRRQRVDVAKQEAARFVKKRINDPIGIVVFGADAISQCPLTLDKNILQKLIYQIKIGLLNPRGTALGTGIATAVNKLKKSKAKSKIIILLTDGRPEADKIPVETAINLAKQFGIKIYSIAVGNRSGGYGMGAFGMIQKHPDSIDERLLKKIALETNGKFFRANNPQEMKKIYDTIDKLETTEYQTDIFSRYYEAFSLFVWPLILLFFFISFLRLFVWRTL